MPRGTYLTNNRQWWRDGATGDARKEAARHLSLMARRFMADRAGAGDVEEAIALWREACRPGEVKRP